MKAIFLAATITLIGLGVARASTEADVMTCAGISDEKERLACFDATAKLILARMVSSPENYILQRFKKPADK